MSLAGPTAQALASTYRGRRVLVTGHTGFKGAWLTLWLQQLGAEVTGFALPPDDPRGLFAAAQVSGACTSITGDVRDPEAVRQAVARARPEWIFHLAAQSLVRRSYREPAQTFETNVMGTVQLLEAARALPGPCAVVVVTTDKVYENSGTHYGYREDDPLGGHDPYAASKAAAELVAAAYRRSFFPATGPLRLATARAGNVIGGGDFAEDRLVPDAIRALERGLPVPVRNPQAIRPWQHVLEPLCGYLWLGARLAAADGEPLARAWNFGPRLESARPVEALVAALVAHWGEGRFVDASQPGPHEASLLRLNIEQAFLELGWAPRWSFDESVARTVAWYRAQANGADAGALRALCLEQIAAYLREVR